jgi:hypothetical protein
LVHPAVKCLSPDVTFKRLFQGNFNRLPVDGDLNFPLKESGFFFCFFVVVSIGRSIIVLVVGTIPIWFVIVPFPILVISFARRPWIGFGWNFFAIDGILRVIVAATLGGTVLVNF